MGDVDALVGARLRRLPHSGPTDRVLEAHSIAVEHARLWLCCCCAGVVVDHRRRAEWARAALAVGATEGVCKAIKRVVRRERPADQVVAPGSRYSFPSAHTANTMAAARSFPRGRSCWWGVLVAATGFSRPYLGVHYPSDVVGGAVLGWLVSERAGRAGRQDRRRRARLR